jgi:class 3 adenylate cyclase/DNA-binding response OmpR family regulator
LILDSPVLEELVQQGCAPLGVEVSVHSSFSPGLLRELAAKTPRVILLRRSATTADGRRLAEVLHAEPRLRACRFVVASSDPVLGPRVLGHARLQLPCTPEQIRSVVRAQLSAIPQILVVDDSRAHRRWVSAALTDAGWGVREAEDGKAALRNLDLFGPADHVLSDVEMPVMDGFALCGAIKDDPSRAMTPVLLLTSQISADAIARGYAVGADDYLIKPAVPAELVARVRRLVTARSLARPERLLVLDAEPRRARALESSLVSQGFDVARGGLSPEDTPAGPEAQLVVVDEDVLEHVGVDAVLGLVEEGQAPVVLIARPGAAGGPVQPQALSDLGAALGPERFTVIARPYPPERLVSEVERLLSFARGERQRTLLHRYLSGEALQAVESWLVTGRRDPIAVSRTRTVLFADLVGFTTLCETLPAAEVVRVLNAFFDATVPALVRHGASIDKFIGDCILAVFDGDSRGAAGAVQGALELVRRVLPALRAELGVDLRLRVGIHSGEVVVGDVGSRDFRRDFTVIGDTVNVAQRIQSEASVDEVLLGAPTARLLSGAFPLGQPRTVALKGRAAPMEVWPLRREPSPSAP